MRARHLVLCVFVLALPIGLHAQNLDSTVSALTALSKSAETWVPYLHGRDQAITWMTFGVIVLGAAATVTALATGAKIKWVTAAITASIAIIGGVKSQIFHADVENYGGLAVTTEVWIKHVKDNVEAYTAAKAINADGRLADDDRRDYDTRFKQNLGDWQQIDDRARKIELSFEVPRPGTQAALWLPGEATLHASAAAPDAPQSAQMQKQQMQQSVASFVGRGVGVCSTVFGASEYARFDGRRRIAQQIDGNASGRALDALIGALDGPAVDQVDHLTVDPATRLATQVTQVTLSRILAQPTYLKWKGDEQAAPRFMASVAVPAGANGPIEVGSKAVPRGLEGAFVFLFAVTHQGGMLTAQLQEIRTFDDSSVGSTRWSFDVMSGAQRLFSMPLHRLEDGGKPTVCRMQPDERLQGSVRVGAGPAELKVLGFKPKDY